MSSWLRLGSVILLLGLVAGCGASRDVADVERMLAERYLKPLEAAGIHATVESACRYRGEFDAPWHLSTSLRLDAAPARVAKVLADEGIVVDGDRDPMIVQQIRNDPSHGWNGSLTSAEGGSTLGLVFNNATRSDHFAALGWADICPEPAGVS
jgi:hypothetical protein